MIDNVRRGGEIVGGQGGAVPDFTFAAIYYATKFENGEFKPFYEKGKCSLLRNPSRICS